MNGREQQTYQRLEFLGDRVLGLVIADMLVERFPDAPEGELSRRLARLVSRETCTEVAEEMELAKYLRIGGGAEGRRPRDGERAFRRLRGGDRARSIATAGSPPRAR